jgi:hypothetical protein
VSSALAGVLGVSLGVLGWVSAQAATFGLADHVHLTPDGATTHRHDYAAPLATGAGVVALLAVLVLLLVHLTSNHPSSDRPRSGATKTSQASPFLLAGRVAPALAALLFVMVEGVAFAGSSTPVGAAAAVLVVGAGAQLLVSRAASSLTNALIRGIENVSEVPALTSCAAPRPSVLAVAATGGAMPSAPGVGWSGRAPPRPRSAFAPTL